MNAAMSWAIFFIDCVSVLFLWLIKMYCSDGMLEFPFKIDSLCFFLNLRQCFMFYSIFCILQMIFVVVTSACFVIFVVVGVVVDFSVVVIFTVLVVIVVIHFRVFLVSDAYVLCRLPRLYLDVYAPTSLLILWDRMEIKKLTAVAKELNFNESTIQTIKIMKMK